MSSVTFKNTPIKRSGELPALNSLAADFNLIKIDLTETSLKDYTGKKIILNIFPSLDTAVCAASVRHFNEKAGQFPNTVVLCVSADLPFAQKRFCATENIENVIPVSSFRSPDFGKNYGVVMTDGPLAGLLSRAVVIINEKGKVIYTQQVPEITNEPDYDAVIAFMKA